MRDWIARRNEFGQYGWLMPVNCKLMISEHSGILSVLTLRCSKNWWCAWKDRDYLGETESRHGLCRDQLGPTGRDREGPEVVSGRNTSRPGLSRTASGKNRAYSLTFPDQRRGLTFSARSLPVPSHIFQDLPGFEIREYPGRSGTAVKDREPSVTRPYYNEVWERGTWTPLCTTEPTPKKGKMT